jgi:hypothetical protein
MAIWVWAEWLRVGGNEDRKGNKAMIRVYEYIQ